LLPGLRRIGRGREQSQKNPAAFLTLVGKVLPLQMTGANDGPVMIITGVPRVVDQIAP
jgi:hypothetical protein